MEARKRKKQKSFHKEIQEIMNENARIKRREYSTRKSQFMIEVLPSIKELITEEAKKDNSTCKWNIPLIYSNQDSLSEYVSFMHEGLEGFSIQICSHVIHEYFCEISW